MSAQLMLQTHTHTHTHTHTTYCLPALSRVVLPRLCCVLIHVCFWCFQTLLRMSEPTLEAIVMDAPYQSAVVEDLLRNQDKLV